MQKKEITVLGINPGTRYLGFAVFKGTELREWGVRGASGKWSNKKREKLKAIISDLIGQHGVDALALKEIPACRSSAKLSGLIESTEDLGRQNGIKTYRYSIKDLEAAFSKEKINKKQLADIVAEHYPVLYAELGKEKIRRNPYYIRMFEAVALASTCFYQIEKH